MTCRDMGGPCDMEMTANTPNEMMKKGEEHLEKYHPEIADKMENMTMEENKEWNDNFMKKWKNTPDMK